MECHKSKTLELMDKCFYSIESFKFWSQSKCSSNIFKINICN